MAIWSARVLIFNHVSILQGPLVHQLGSFEGWSKITTNMHGVLSQDSVRGAGTLERRWNWGTYGTTGVALLKMKKLKHFYMFFANR